MASKSKVLALPTAEEIAQRFADNRSLDDLFALIRRADTGDEAALARLQEAYALVPELAGQLVTLQYNAELAILDNVQPGARETFLTQARQLRKRLAGENPSEMERLLVNRVVLDWLHSLQADRACTLRVGESRPLSISDFYDKQAERAQKRFLRSMTTLATVRKLLRPTVQVNIAEQQVNVAGDVK